MKIRLTCDTGSNDGAVVEVDNDTGAEFHEQQIQGHSGSDGVDEGRCKRQV